MPLALCTVTGGPLELPGGGIAAGRSLYLKRTLLNGALIATGPTLSVNLDRLAGGEATVFYVQEIVSDAAGLITFTVPQLSTVYLEGNVSGYNNGEVALSIPATATATLESLTPATFPIDVTTFTFLSLVDTPDDFTGDALKIVRVNAAGTALEFSAPVVVDNETVQDALSAFFPDVAPFDWTYDDAGDRVTLAILDATASARGLMSTAYAARLDQLEVGDSPTFAGLTLTGLLTMPTNANAPTVGTSSSDGIGISAGGNFSTYVGGSRIARVGGTQTLILSGAQFGWDTNATGVSGTTDLGLARRAAGVARITNGGTGSGQLLIGSSTDTIAAQLHTLSNAIGVIPFIAEGPAGQTANLFEARVNGVAKVTVNAGGGIITTSTITTPASSSALSALGATNDIYFDGTAGTFHRSNTDLIIGIDQDNNSTTQKFQVKKDGSLFTGGSPLLEVTEDGKVGLNSGSVLGWASVLTNPLNGSLDTSLSRNAAGIVQVGDGAANANGKVRAAEYQVAAIKVLGAQGAAVIDATDNPSAITQLNALLARLRAHGLIAT